MHRIGGIEKDVDTGNIDYSPANHQAMTDARKDKIDGVAVHPDQEVALGESRRQARGGRLGLHLRPDPPGGAPRARARAATSATSTSATSGRCRENLGELLAGLRRRCWCPR